MIALFRSVFHIRLQKARCDIVGRQIRDAVAENAQKSNELMEVIRQRVSPQPMAMAANGHKKA